MTIFDLLFLALSGAALATLAAAVVLAARKQFRRAGRILRHLVAGAAAYMAVVIISSAVMPRRILGRNDTECFDDWCISLAGFERSPADDLVQCSLDFRLASRALRVDQREFKLVVYLSDDRGRRYDPLRDASAAPFDTLLHPGDAVRTRRTFLVSPDARGLHLVIAHEGGFPIRWLIIGYDAWFRKPPAMRLASDYAPANPASTPRM